MRRPERLMLRDQIERLLIDERIDDVEHDVLDQPLDLAPIPALRELQHAFLEALHPLLVRPDEEEHELRVCAAHQLPARHHPGSVQRASERQGRRPADDRLVEVEEGGFHGTIVGHRADTFGNAERRGREHVPAFRGTCRSGQPIDARPTQLSPVATFIADARKESAPAVLFANSRTVNDPLGAFVTRLPAKMRVPFSLIRTAQV